MRFGPFKIKNIEAQLKFTGSYKKKCTPVVNIHAFFIRTYFIRTSRLKIAQKLRTS